MSAETEAHADALELLSEEGIKFEITRVSESSVNSTTLRSEQIPMVFNAVGVYYDPSVSAIKSGWEQSVGEEYRADLKYIILKPTGTDEVMVGDTVQAIGKDSGVPEGRPVIVAQVNPVGPWGHPIFYRVAAE